MRIRTLGMTVLAIGLSLAPAFAAPPTFEPAGAREDATLAPLTLVPEGGRASTGHATPADDPDVPPAPPTDAPPAPPTDAPPAPPTEEPPPAPPTEEPPPAPPSEPPSPPTTPPSGPPTPPTTPEAETGPVAIFGPKNLLVLRYRSRFPPVVHVKNPDGEGDGAWTAYTSGGQIKMVKGLLGKPFIIFTANQADIDKAAQLGGSLTAENKLALVKHFRSLGEKPLEAQPPGEWLKQPKLLPLEMRLLKITQLGRKVRWLYNKVETAPNEAVKIFYGAQIKILSLYIDHVVGKCLDAIWEEVDGELDRGQVAIVPGRNFDLFLNLVGVHVMYRDEDLTGYDKVLGRLKQRLNGEMLSVGDYPPGQQELRKQAIEKRLQLVTDYSDLTAQGP